MFIPLDPSSGLPIFRQIIEQVRRMVASGALAPGDKLESVRDLAARLAINPLTVAKAYQELERAGVIELRRGVGMFVRAAARPQTKGTVHMDVVRAAERLALEASQAGLGLTETKRVLAEAWRAVRVMQPPTPGDDENEPSDGSAHE